MYPTLENNSLEVNSSNEQEEELEQQQQMNDTNQNIFKIDLLSQTSLDLDDIKNSPQVGGEECNSNLKSLQDEKIVEKGMKKTSTSKRPSLQIQLSSSSLDDNSLNSHSRNRSSQSQPQRTPPPLPKQTSLLKGIKKKSKQVESVIPTAVVSSSSSSPNKSSPSKSLLTKKLSGNFFSSLLILILLVVCHKLIYLLTLRYSLSILTKIKV